MVNCKIFLVTKDNGEPIIYGKKEDAEKRAKYDADVRGYKNVRAYQMESNGIDDIWAVIAYKLFTK